MVISRRQMGYNHSPRMEAIKYLVIHDTGNPSAGADADAHFRHFNSGNWGSSADFFVDDTQIVQANDYHKYYSWHCGDGHGRYGITNSNSVGIEICINQDGDYSRAVANAAELTRGLMSELGIPIGRVVRHYDASRKNCPASMSKNGWAAWKEFKQSLEGKDELMSREYDEIIKKLDSVAEIINRMGGEIQELKEAAAPKMVYDYIDDNLPQWARPTIQKLVDCGALKGDQEGRLGLTDELIRMLVINDRMGLYE